MEKTNANVNTNVGEFMNDPNDRIHIHQYYPSNIVGTRIRNAVSGITYQHLVGSKDEALYFRVIDATGRCDNNGRKLTQNCSNSNPNKLFYENKQEYLEHRGELYDESDDEGEDYSTK
jgi:hypothetical protein